MSDDDPVFAAVHDFYDNCLQDYLHIAAMKNESPIYNPNWEKDGELLECLKYMKDYIEQQEISNIENLQIFQEKGITPALFFDVPNPSLEEKYTVLFISHIDKIPFGTGWERCDPSHPVISDGYLYGRGGANSLYAIFTILALIKACDINKMKRPNIAVLIESSFESGSIDLVSNLEKASKFVNEVNQIICFDTWSPTKENYHYMKSCRGCISFDVKITTGKESVHSGFYGGLIPDPTMILNNILSNNLEKIEKSEDGLATNIKLPLLELEITEEEKKEAQDLIAVTSFKIVNYFHYSGVSDLIGSKKKEATDDYITAYLNGVLRPAYSILGFEEMPDVENSSGSIKPNICARLCFRTPPTLDTKDAFNKLKQLFTTNPPFGAKIEILNEEIIPGVDLEKTNNNVTEKMIKSFDTFCEKMQRQLTLAVRMGRSFPGLYYLTQKYEKIPIFVTGGANTFSDNVRDGNECISLIRLINYTSCLAYYLCDFPNYKN